MRRITAWVNPLHPGPADDLLIRFPHQKGDHSTPKLQQKKHMTGLFFILSWAGQFIFQMISERNEAEQHGQAFTWSDFFPQFFSSTLENWQSEFLQLVWQAAGLALFYFWGSSQSRESDGRLEAKIDRLLTEQGIDPAEFDYQEEEQVQS